MRDMRSGLAAQAWCDTTDCSLTCSLLVPRVTVRHDYSTQAFLDFWEEKENLATFSDSNLMEFSMTRNKVQQIASTLPTMRVVTRDTTLYGQVRSRNRAMPKDIA